MAFNPFSSFRKYQKYWMAGAVLICMITFVLCSGGIRGTGLDDVLFRWFVGHRGEVLVKANGTKYYYEDIQELKNQRNIANDFMREITKFGIDRLTAAIKESETSGKVDDLSAFRKSLQQTCLTDLFNKLNREPRYFRGSAKLDDLVDFILWRDLANKYGVIITDDALRDFVRNACHAGLWTDDPGYAEASGQVEARVRATHFGASGTVILNALKQEFRVQIAQLALIARWSAGHDNERERFSNMQLKDGRLLHFYLNSPMQARIAPTPEEIGARYRKMRTELTIDLLPISLDVLAEQVKLPADNKAKLELLKNFYDENAKRTYNPNLDTPGFLFPARVEVQFLTADPSMEFYRKPAKVVSDLKKMPLVAFDPLSPLTGLLTWLAAPARFDAALAYNLDAERSSAERKWNDYYRFLAVMSERYASESDPKKKEDLKSAIVSIQSRPPAAYKYSASSWTTPDYYSPGQYNLALEKPDPRNGGQPEVASLVAGVGASPFVGWSAYQANAYQNQAKKIALMVGLDRGKRAVAGVDLFLARTPLFSGGGAFTAAALTYDSAVKPQFLPVAGEIEDQLRSKSEEELAQRWVNTVMLDLKTQLEAVKGRDTAFPAQVAKLQAKYSRQAVEKDGKQKTIYGLRFGETPLLRNEYDIEYDEALKPLRDSFDKYRIAVNQIEGRSGKSEMLREGDFAKLFFGTEPLGVGPLEPYTPKIWPPYVTVPKWRESALAQKSLEQRLFDTAEKPIVFWKSVKRGSEPLEWNPNNDKMVDFVAKQYSRSEARSKLMDEVKKVAEEVKKTQRSEGKDLHATMLELAKKAGTDLIALNKVAILVENPDRRSIDPVSYVEYALPRGRVPFARSDMVKQLLALHRLAEPLKMESEDSEGSGKPGASGATTGQAKALLEELDKLNASLFSPDLAKNPRAKVGQVQVLTNRPRSVYYIATVVNAQEPSSFGYFGENSLAQGGNKEGSPNTFADQAQQEFGKELWQLFSKQMRAQGDVDISEQARKQFADDPQVRQ